MMEVKTQRHLNLQDTNTSASVTELANASSVYSASPEFDIQRLQSFLFNHTITYVVFGTKLTIP